MPKGEGSLLDDLDAAPGSGSSEKPVQQITGLVLKETDRPNERQIGVSIASR
jgi:hypothetical protein